MFSPCPMAGEIFKPPEKKNMESQLKYIKEALREIEFLKSELTAKEKERLNIESLMPAYNVTCLYGQSTGWCYGPRATELIKELKPTIWFDGPNEILPSKEAFRRENGYLFEYKGVNKYTVLENLSIRFPDNNIQIINYLKGVKKEMPKLVTYKNEPVGIRA